MCNKCKKYENNNNHGELMWITYLNYFECSEECFAGRTTDQGAFDISQ